MNKTEEEMLIKLLEEYRDKEGDYFPEDLWSLQPGLILFLEQSNARTRLAVLEAVAGEMPEEHDEEDPYNQYAKGFNDCLSQVKEIINELKQK